MIFGQVTNATSGRRLEQVVVTATEVHRRVTRVTVTDARGLYRFTALPSGTYTLSFKLPEERFGFFNAPRQQRIRLRPGSRVRVDEEIWPALFTAAPLITRVFVDGSSAAPSLRYVDSGFLTLFPVNPPMGKGGSVRSFDGLAALIPHTQDEAYGVSILGASPFENRYVLDGLSIQDPFLGVNALPLSIELIQSVGVLTGGVMAEDGPTPGGTLRVETRQAPEVFHGTLFTTWVPGGLGGTPTPASGPTGRIREQNRLSSQLDVGVTLGGSLVKDRLWFFVGVAPALSFVEHTRTLAAREPGAPEEEPRPPFGSPWTRLANERTLQALGTLTYRDGAHGLSLSVITTPTRSGGEGSLPVDPLTGRVRDFLDASPAPLPVSVVDGHTSLGNLRYFGAVLGTQVEARLGWLHRMASVRPDAPSGLSSIGTLSEETADRYQAHARVSGWWRFLGDHDSKVGLSAEGLAHTRLESLSGAEPASAPRWSRQRGTLLSGFVQDRWSTPTPIKINAGLRYDLQRMEAVEQRLAFAPAARVSPSLGLVWDAWRTKFFASYARHVTQVPLVVLDVPFAGTVVEPELVLPSTSELLVGGEHALLGQNLVSATYTRRSLESALMPLSNEEGGTFFLGNPGRGLARERPEAERTYEAVTVLLHHVPYWTNDTRYLFDRWGAQVSYTWSRVYGNYEGPLQLAPGWGEPVLRPTLGLSSPLQDALGPLSADRTHTVRLMGGKEFFFGQRLSASLGVSYRGRSGTPIQSLSESSTLSGSTVFALPRGSSGERTPWVHDIDLRAVVNYQAHSSLRMASLSLEVFNVFNFQAVTRVNEFSTGLDGSTPNPEFKKPIQYQTPRQVRLGLRCTF